MAQSFGILFKFYILAKPNLTATLRSMSLHTIGYKMKTLLSWRMVLILWYIYLVTEFLKENHLESDEALGETINLLPTRILVNPC